MTLRYVQANGATFVRHIIDVEPTRWDDDHFCRVAALTDEQRVQFGVFPLKMVTPPAFEPATQDRAETDATLIDGEWCQTWVVRDLTAEEIGARLQALQSSIVNATQARLDTFAQTRGYDGILSAATYATSTVTQFATEGQYAVQARDATWAALYTILAEVQAGTRPVPTGYADIEGDLPTLTWPT